MALSGSISSEKQQEKSFISRISSLTMGLSAVSAERTQSLPVMPVADSATSSSEEHIIDISNIAREEQKHIKRSFSAPISFSGSLEHMDSVGLDLMILTSHHPGPVDGVTPNSAIQANNATQDDDTHTLEEQSVCRICLSELEEGGETLKMECSCKGELALAHQDCAVQWFSIKGNKTCDVCKKDVQNLPTALLKRHNNQTARRFRADASQQDEVPQYRVWHDVPVLVLVSILAYFCLLEQLLVAEMGTHALALALPFSSVLGLLSSMIASIVVSRSHIWAYASIQFLIVILFAHIMYNVLRVTPVLAVLLSSFIGFGITMSVNSLIMEYLTWVARQFLQSAHQQITSGQLEQSRDSPQAENEDTAVHQEAQRHNQRTQASG